MSTGTRVALFGALLAAVFGLALVAGRALDPATSSGEPAHDGMSAAASSTATTPHGHDAATAGGSTGSGRHSHDANATGGLRIAAATTTLRPGHPARFAFRIVDEHGETVRDFETEQARRMHLVVVRRDLRRFQHLHPAQAADGSWSVPLTLPDAGVYHAFADFVSAGERHALGTDLFAAGAFAPRPLPAIAATTTVDGYGVRLQEPQAGELRFTVTRAGAPVLDLQPYLGARGHLVMLREGDLAYEHVHPLGGAALAFDASAARPGRYRLFLQFRHGDRVHTAAFTHAVAS